jgi:hypothetical protein
MERQENREHNKHVREIMFHMNTVCKIDVKQCDKKAFRRYGLE